MENLKTHIETGKPIAVDMEKEKEIFDGFLNTPLEEMKPKQADAHGLLKEAVVLMNGMTRY